MRRLDPTRRRRRRAARAVFARARVFFRARLPALPKAPSWGMALSRLDQTWRRRRRATHAVFARARVFFARGCRRRPKPHLGGWQWVDLTRRGVDDDARGVPFSCVPIVVFRLRPPAPPKAFSWGLAMGRLDQTRRRRRRAARSVFVRSHFFCARIRRRLP